jgi:hypothetical protein
MLNQRRDYLCVAQGVQDLHRILYNVTALPVAPPEPAALAVALRAAGDAMRTAGRAAVTASGGDWPADLADGVHRFVDQNLPAR